MTLRAKTLTIIVATFACLAALLYAASQFIIMRSFRALEDTNVREDVRETLSIFADELRLMDKLAHDYASWDDTYEYMGDPKAHPKYIKSNIADETFLNQKLNLIAYVDGAGRCVYAKSFDLARRTEVPVSEEIRESVIGEPLLLMHPDPAFGVQGLILLRNNPMLVVSRPVLTSENKGPPRGAVIMAHYLSKAAIQHREDVLNLKVDMQRADAAALPDDYRTAQGLMSSNKPVAILSHDSQFIAGYTTINDIRGKPALFVKVSLSRDIYREGLKSIRYFLLWLFSAGFVVASAVALLLQKEVLSRLTALRDSLGRIGASSDLSERVRVTGKDEISDLSLSVNAMLVALEHSQRELRESETRYKRIVENTRDVIMLTRPDGVITYLSPSSAQVLGYTPEDLAGDEPWTVPPEDLEKVKKARAQALQGSSGSNVEHRVLTKDGEMKWVLHSWSPVTVDGQLHTVVSIMRDITDHKRMEEEIIRAQKLESVGILAGGIAHDFNNILTAFTGYLSLAKEAAAPSAEIVGLIAEAEKASVRARNLTQQLLTFSKGGMPIKESITLARPIRDAAAFAMSGSSARCEFSIPRDLWTVQADEGQISQVINNLVINAVQAMPGGGMVRIAAANVAPRSDAMAPSPEKSYVRISVRDEGIGIPFEHLHKVFDPYFTTKQRGSGLGLATCYSIIRNHEGMIRVRSEIGKGTAFTFYLPASPGGAPREEVQSTELAKGEGKLLIMDDDPSVREVAGRMLNHIGYDVTAAADGAEMLALYREAQERGEPFDAVILDLTIPGGMGGKEAVKKLREADRNAKAIVSSGYSTDPLMSDFREHGFDGFIPKPYRMREMARELKRVLSEHEHHRGQTSTIH